MRRRWSAVLVLVLAGGLAGPIASAPVGAAPTGPDALSADLDRILADPRLADSHAGVVVRDPATDQVLYSRQANARATPASNLKLLTAAAAMDELGPDYRFRTEVRTSAPGSPLSDVHLRGTGDPTVRPADYDQLAKQVADSGARVVRLLADDSWFDDVPLGSGWAWDDEPAYYAAPVSALTVAPNDDFDAGSAIVRVTPGAEGAPAGVVLDPPTSVLRVRNETTTGPADSQPTLSVQRLHGSGEVVVSGSVPAGSAPAEEYSSVPDPTAYATDVFARALRAHGVQVTGTGEAPAPRDSEVIAARDSMPLRQLLVPFLKLSNNMHAEALVKAMGRHSGGDGSWDAGLPVLADRLRGLGVDPGRVQQVDGSGLSPMDSVSPAQLALLLDNVRQRPWFREFDAALPVAGNPDHLVGGTLRSRMIGTPAEGNVHGKTGSMTGVTSLSGSVTAADGRPLVFSVLFNDFLSDSPDDLQDAIAVRLAQYAGPADRTRGVPAVPRAARPQGVECSWAKSC